MNLNLGVGKSFSGWGDRPKPSTDCRLLQLDTIDPSPTNPRRSMGERELEELAASIRERGLLSPILVRRQNSSSRYVIIAGHRRYAAHQRIGAREILALVVDDRYDARQADIDAVIENLQRADVSAVDAGHAYRRILDIEKISQNELARRLGVSPGHVSKMLAVLELPEDVQEQIRTGAVSYETALDKRAAASQEAGETVTGPAKRKTKKRKPGEHVTPYGVAIVKRGSTLPQLVEALAAIVEQERQRKDAA